MTQEEANLYWSTRDFKKWVVLFKGRNRLVVDRTKGPPTLRRLSSHREVFVRARSRERAIACAKANIPTNERLELVSVRLARPFDLGCVQVPA